MFTNPYPFKYKGHTSANLYGFEKEHIYSFVGKGRHTYLIRVEEYKHDFFGVKFHLKAHSDSINKYNLTTNFNDMTGCVSTCVAVMLEIAEDNQFASFGFIGANSNGEPKKNTKRYRIYQLLMKSKFSPIDYSHHTNVSESIYLLLRKNNIKHHHSIFEIAKEFVQSSD